jgi:hypothetical protein
MLTTAGAILSTSGVKSGKPVTNGAAGVFAGVAMLDSEAEGFTSFFCPEHPNKTLAVNAKTMARFTFF